MIPPRIELGAFCVLGRCDNRYTTESWWLQWGRQAKRHMYAMDARGRSPIERLAKQCDSRESNPDQLLGRQLC